MIISYTNILTIISFILGLSLYLFIYLWIEQLDKNNCECSKLWHTNFIKISSIILITNLIIVNIIQPFFNNLFLKYVTFILPFIFIYFITYLILLFDYIHKLKQLQDCKCSEDWKREYGYYFIIIYFGLLSFIIMSILIMFIFIFFLKKI